MSEVKMPGVEEMQEVTIQHQQFRQIHFHFASTFPFPGSIKKETFDEAKFPNQDHCTRC